MPMSLPARACALALTLLTLAAGCRGLRAPAGEDPATAVRVAPVERGDVVQFTRVQAVLSACREIHLAPRVAGRLQETLVTVGDHVEAGQPLLRLEGREYEAQLKQADAVVAAARANLARLEKGSPATAQQQPELPGAGGADEALAAARSQLGQAEAARELALAQVEAMVLTAPWPGHVWYAKSTPGEMLSPAVAAVGLVDTGRLHASVGLTDRLAVKVSPGQEIVVRVPAAGLETRGRIDQVAPAADPRTRLFQARVVLDNPGGLLRPGMFAELSLPESDRRGVLVVPGEAVVRAGDRDVVYVVQDGLARQRQVATGAGDGVRVEILAGLEEGEQVIVAGQHFVTDGTRVRVEEDW